MAKAKCVNLSAMTDQNIDMNLQQDVDITDEIIDPDLFLRTFGISDDYCNVSDHKEILDIVQPAATSTGQGGDGVGIFQGCQQQGQKQSVIIKNDQMRGGGGQSQVPVSDISLSNLLMQSTSPMMQTMQQQQPQQQVSSDLYKISCLKIKSKSISHLFYILLFAKNIFLLMEWFEKSKT